jgi:hypothetical protein
MRYRGLRAFTGFALAVLSLFTALQARARTSPSLTPEQMNVPAEEQL